MPSSTKSGKTQNQRKRVSENATDSKIAEANEIWHSTAIEDGKGGEDPFTMPSETPIRGKKPRHMNTQRKDPELDSGRGRSETREEESRNKAKKAPVVINPPSGHTFLSTVLHKCGYIIRQPNANNEMFKDVMKFRKTMSDWLVNNDDEMSRVETDASKFQKALKEYLADKPNFINAMKPTRHETELIQPSLLHCLLGIETIQPMILQIVFHNLAEESLESKDESISMCNSILDQLKWLPSLVDKQKFADAVLGITDSASIQIQSLIVKFLPDILPSDMHAYTAEKLLEKFGHNGQQINIALMDCFSSLDIPEGFWTTIRRTAIDEMATAPIQDIPAYFSFLFRAETFNALTEIIAAMREKVELKPERRSAKMEAYQVEIMEKVGFCVTINPLIAKIWVKAVKEDLQHSIFEDIKKIDLLMLFIFVESEKSPAMVPLKQLFQEKEHTLKLFAELMKDNSPMVNYLFSAISKILDTFFRGRDVKCLETASEIAVQLFRGVSAVDAQTLMGNMSNILVNYPPSREAVLNVLTKLSELEPSKLLFFSPLLMGVLEYVMTFPAGQIKALMGVLAVLSETEGRNGTANNFSAEFSILLRKQLTHPDIKIRCFGVYGALASVKCMADKQVPNGEKIRELLKLAWNLVERDEDACNIFLDELATCVDSLPVDICTTYKEILKGKFEKLWTLDAADRFAIKQHRQKKDLKLVVDFDANKECTEDRLVIIFENSALSMSSLVIPAHLRVLALLESKVSKNDLVAIDALLGCPILLPKLADYVERESISDLKYNQRYELGIYLVLAINFFRESVNAFINQENSELRVKVWLRLENILRLQKLLVKHFSAFPALPYAYIAEKTIGTGRDGAGPSGFAAMRAAREGKSGGKPAPEKPKAAPKKKKKARTEAPNEEDGENEEESIVAAPVAAKKVTLWLDEEIQPKAILGHLRRLDPVVFKLLRYPLRSEDESVNFSNVLMNITGVTQNPNQMEDVEKFSPDALALLLLELKRLVSDPRSPMCILGVKKLLQNTCKHIDGIHSILLQNEENDMAEVTESLMKYQCCLRLLIDILISFFGAIGKLDKEEKERAIEKAKSILEVQAVNKSHSEDAVQSQTEVMTNVANYLNGLVSVIKNSTTALNHMKLLKILHDLFGGSREMKKSIDNATRVYLSTDWKLPSAKVDGFLKIWLSTARHPMKVIEHLTEKLLTTEDETVEDEENANVFKVNNSVYKSCTLTNFHVWYSALVSGLSHHVHKTLRRRGDFDDNIQEWINAVKIFQTLVAVTRQNFKQKSLKNFVLLASLKNCKQFLEAFISGGAELLPIYMKQDKSAAVRFLKALQVPCRTIQHVCEHSKIHTDLNLLKSVPIVKRVLETFVFRVREVLGNYGAAGAFWMGQLKHKDLQGEQINSQIIDSDIEFSDLESGDEDDDYSHSVRAAPLSGITEPDPDDDAPQESFFDDEMEDE